MPNEDGFIPLDGEWNPDNLEKFFEELKKRAGIDEDEDEDSE